MFFIYVLLLVFPKSFGDEDLKSFGTENWTSCEEFLQDSTFDAEQVIDVDWKIFYFWNYEQEKSYNIKFRYATPVLVDRFKVELKNHIVTASLNWSNALMFMETSIDFSALYLTTNTPGKFRLIPSFAFQMDTIPFMIFGLKVVPPGYLGIMNCKYRMCYALAPVDKMPNNKEINLEAERIGFRGDANRSYLVEFESPPISPYTADDEEEDEQLEVESEAFELDD